MIWVKFDEMKQNWTTFGPPPKVVQNIKIRCVLCFYWSLLMLTVLIKLFMFIRGSSCCHGRTPLLWRSLGCVSSADPRRAKRHKWPSESCLRHRRMAPSISGGARTGLGPHQSHQRPLAPVIAQGLCLDACWLDPSSLWDSRLNFFEEVQRVHFCFSCCLICSSKDPRGRQNLPNCLLFPV